VKDTTHGRTDRHEPNRLAQRQGFWLRICPVATSTACNFKMGHDLVPMHSLFII